MILCYKLLNVILFVSSFRQHFLLFQKKNPCFCFALAIFSSILLTFNYFHAIIIICFSFLFLEKKTLFLFFSFLTIPFIFLKIFISIPTPLPTHYKIEGKGVFFVSKASVINNIYSHQGTLLFFQDDTNGKKYKNLPCLVYDKTKRLEKSQYFIEGKLLIKNHHYSLCNPTKWILKEKNITWLTIISSSIRKKFIKYVSKNYPNKEQKNFLLGISIGEPLDNIAKNSFAKLGVSHITVISGLHFSFILSLLYFCTFWIPKGFRNIILFFAITAFTWLLPSSYAVYRAWISSSLFLISIFFKGKCLGMNRLSIALILILLLNPQALFSLSFQLSFLATMGILLFFEPINYFLRQNLWFPHLSKKSLFEKMLAAFHRYFVASLALSISAQVFVIPILINCFHFFDLNGLVYNLIIPQLTFVSLSLLGLGSLLQIQFIHEINQKIVQLLLNIIDYPYVVFKTFYISSIPSWGIFLYSVILFSIGVVLRKNKNPIII